MNQYERMREPIGTPDVHTTAGGDLYLALSNVDQAAQSASITVIATPLIVWIWIAVILMGVGALFGLIPARRRTVATSTASDLLPAESTAEAA